MSIDRLTLDRMMLGASRIWPQDIGALALSTAQPAGRDRSSPDGTDRRAIEAAYTSSHGSDRPSTCQRWGLGGPLWVDDQSFDIDEHLREFPVPPPGGEVELLDVVEHLRRQPLGHVTPTVGHRV